MKISSASRASCSKHTISDIAAQWSMYKGVEHIVKHKIPGDIVECGVWNGVSILLAALALAYFGDTSRKLYLYDTFEGMPLPDEVDVDCHGNFVKGIVEDTMPGTLPETISMLRLDTDLYGSTYHELVHGYPRLVKGGVLIIDDYGYFMGSWKATDQYIEENVLPLLLTRLNQSVHLAIKP